MRIRFTNLNNFVMSVPMSIFEIRKTIDILEFAFDKNEYQYLLLIHMQINILLIPNYQNEEH